MIPRATSAPVVDGLGAVAVGVEQERPVVLARLVLGAQPGRPVVAIAGLGADSPELVDLVARRGHEADVEPPRRGFAASAAVSENSPTAENVLVR